jgi:two-component system, chemotaxis family, sensor kinase CheA
MKDFKDSFIEEALGLITNLETVMLELEIDPDNMGLIQEVFRTMHTLKGTSSMFGFSNISEFTHDLESIYDLIRNGGLRLSKKISDMTLASVDHIQNLLKDPDFKSEINHRKQKELLSVIKQIIGDLGINENMLEVVKSKTVNSKQIKTYLISFRPDEQLLFRGVNLLFVFSDLAALGQLHMISYHELQETRADSDYQTWGIYLATTEDISAIEDVFLFIIEFCKIVKIADANLFDEEDFIQKAGNIEFFHAHSIEEVVFSKAVLSESADSLVSIVTENVPVEMENSNDDQQETADAEVITLKADNESFKQISRLVTSRVSVESEKLDQLMYLVSELVITRAELDLVIEKKDYTQLDLLKEKFDKLTNQFRDNTLSMRLMPINDILVRFRRLVRDLSQSMKKEIEFVTMGTETELDKNVMDALVEPMLHLLRNCLDHGIEMPEEREAAGKNRKGQIKLTASHSGSNVFITVEDDGKGIDPEFLRKKAIAKGFISPDAVLTKREIYNLIFLPGFSTAETVSDISGRGVGMDVVKKKINEIRGEVEIESEVGSGTCFTIKLQQTISILDTLLIESADKYFLVPLSEVEFCGSDDSSEIFSTSNKHLKYNNNLIPFVHLRSELDLKGSDGAKIKYVIINKNNKQFAILIDKIVGEYQAVLKPLGKLLQRQEFLSGASIMGDGKLALMLNSGKLLDYALKQ